MPALVSFGVRKSPGFDEYFSSLPRNVKAIAVEAAAEYLIGNDNHGLKHEPKYSYISRTDAYGEPFSTDKQRRWFFWALSEGLIKPGQDNRTHAIRDGWKLAGTRTPIKIVNDVDGVQWVMGKKQARLNAMAGWQYYMDVIQNNMKGAIRHASAKVGAYLKSRR